MEIIDIKHIEDCFDGSFIKEIVLGDVIAEEFILYLCKCGRFQYHRDFARPFFQIEKEGMFIMKGVEGNRTLRVILYRDSLEEGLEFLRGYIDCYSLNTPDEEVVDSIVNC